MAEDLFADQQKSGKRGAKVTLLGGCDSGLKFRIKIQSQNGSSNLGGSAVRFLGLKKKKIEWKTLLKGKKKDERS